MALKNDFERRRETQSCEATVLVTAFRQFSETRCTALPIAVRSRTLHGMHRFFLDRLILVLI